MSCDSALESDTCARSSRAAAVSDVRGPGRCGPAGWAGQMEPVLPSTARPDDEEFQSFDRLVAEDEAHVTVGHAAGQRDLVVEAETPAVLTR